VTKDLNLSYSPIYLVTVMYKFLLRVEDDLIMLSIYNFLERERTVYVLAVAVKQRMLGL